MKASLGVGGSYDVDLQEHPALYWRLSRRQVPGAGRVADCLLTIALPKLLLPATTRRRRLESDRSGTVSDQSEAGPKTG